MNNEENNLEQKSENLKVALQAGLMSDIAAAKGGTGELRGDMSSDEFSRRKKRRKAAKESRRRNKK